MPNVSQIFAPHPMLSSATWKPSELSRKRSGGCRSMIPGVTELATQINEIAARVLAGSSTQKDLTEAAAAAGTSGTIETTRRPAGDILG